MSRVGRWQLEEIIAEGGFGAVHRARRDDGLVAAVKVLRAELAAVGEASARLLREVEAVRRVDHPAVVKVLDAGQDGGVPWYAMELLDGVDLGAWLAVNGRMPPARVLAVLAPVCEALATAHRAGIVHRDVKASNVFLCKGGRVVLLDFGVAKLLDPEAPALTRSRQLIGTPTCMAPEQIAGRPATVRTDVYAVAALAYKMLTGHSCFGDESPTMLGWLHLHARRPRPSRLAPLGPGVDDVIVRAMSIDPAGRQPGARELLAELSAAIGGAAAEPDEGPAVAIHVEIAADRDALADAGDALAADLEATLSGVAAELDRRGFRRAFVTGTSALYVKAGHSADGEAAARALPHGPLAITTRVRAGTLGELLRLDWV